MAYRTGIKKYILKTACGHMLTTDIELMLQYPTDKHYVRCPICRDRIEMQGHSRVLAPPTAWSEVVSFYERMPAMSNTHALIVPDDILRLQPSIPPNRQRIKRYVPRILKGSNRRR